MLHFCFWWQLYRREVAKRHIYLHFRSWCTFDELFLIYDELDTHTHTVGPVDILHQDLVQLFQSHSLYPSDFQRLESRVHWFSDPSSDAWEPSPLILDPHGAVTWIPEARSHSTNDELWVFTYGSLD